MSTRQPKYDPNPNVDTRLSRLETIIDSISLTLDKIQTKLDTETKINWTPIGLGLTVFMAVVGSFGTIYTTRMGNADDNIKQITEQTQNLAVASTEQRITLQSVKDRQDDMKQKIEDIDKRVKAIEESK